MTIQVRSNDPMPQEGAAVSLSDVASAEPTEKSAQEAFKAPEQNEKAPSKSDSESKEKEAEEEDSDAEGSDEEHDAKDDGKDKPRKKGGFQRRIDKLNARIAAREQELEYWRTQALKGAGDSKKPDHQASDEPKDSKPKASLEGEGRPNPDSFDTHAEYVEALTDWKIEQREKKAKAEAEKAALISEQQKAFSSHVERVKSFAEKTKDFAEVISDVDDIPVSATVQQIIVTSENGPELMYELAKNRDEYARICKLPPIAAARELGKLELRLSSSKPASDAKQEPKSKPITKAPKPIDPVGTAKGAVAKSLDDPSLTQAEYEALRREQIKRRRA